MLTRDLIGTDHKQGTQNQYNNQSGQRVNGSPAEYDVRNHRGIAVKSLSQPASGFAWRCKPARNAHQNVVCNSGTPQANDGLVAPSACGLKRIFWLPADTPKSAKAVP
jgi:hypothetical protein